MNTTNHEEEYKGYVIKLVMKDFPTQFKINSEIGKITDETYSQDHRFKAEERTFHKTDGMLNALHAILEERKSEIDKKLPQRL